MKYIITTLGCKVNQFETAAIEKMLSSRGHKPACGIEADVVIVNSCAVTAESGRKSRQAIRRLMAENPGALSALCGCYSQVNAEEAKQIGVDVIFGSGDRAAFVDALEKAYAERETQFNVDDPFSRKSIERLPGGAMEGRTRAHMKIVDGCDNYCSYCIIPYARGHVRSMPLEECAAEAAKLASEGYKEIVVTGIEISSYGIDLPEKPSLAMVIKAVASAAPEARIHIGSLEPTIVDEEFCIMLEQLGNICPHFHLALQSGCDRTLQNMNRKYDTGRFYAATELLRRYFPACAISADLITGFPGESEQDHTDTLAFIEKCRFSSMHIFPYSIRPGTAAASMDGQLEKSLKNARARQAQTVAKKMQKSYLESMLGKTLRVLFETEKDGIWRGHSDNYCEVCAEGTQLHGVFADVLIKELKNDLLYGIII
ncbi:MAG: tRNA (N(6)-L-threonylcarbamoyladenosine(37)-C(2))-methylthiotransferase MtaB [Ruminococcaceae bacterium]|nr:tRNA (N(6)-L-threonylcarbamoyladenosine(37)-C(2))-methylthiotransferase MtaB [Oscillospiraceae bacterium]